LGVEGSHVVIVFLSEDRRGSKAFFASAGRAKGRDLLAMKSRDDDKDWTTERSGRLRVGEVNRVKHEAWVVDGEEPKNQALAKSRSNDVAR
jgi:hypothetical protein